MVTRSEGFFTRPWLKSETCSNASIPLISKNIPQSVVALTIAFSTISSTLIFFNASLISAFLLFSKTALLETQTFPLFLSILVATQVYGNLKT